MPVQMHRSRWSIEAKIRIGFGLALITAVALGLVAYYSTSELISTLRRVAHSHAVMEDLDPRGAARDSGGDAHFLA
jgi:CHASE3 domain sensor protein